MLFRRNKPKKLVFSDFLERARQAGFTVASPAAGGGVRISRGNVAAVAEDGGEHPRFTQRAGIIVNGEIARLVDGGYQKFLQTPSGKRQPALAENLRAVHQFQEDLREAFGLTSLYNEGLGSVSNVYLYDRVEDRDTPRTKKPWEIKV